jgi:phospholipase D1/2
MQPVPRSTTPQATLFEPGRNCWHASDAPRAAMLVDAANYFEAFASAALHAEHSIIILAWDFDSRTRLLCNDPGKGDPPSLLGPFLNWLVARRQSLHVYVLDWDYPMVYGTDRELPPTYGLGWVPRRRVHLRYDNTHPVAGSHHQKVVVIDDRLAFVGGLDLTNRRWDTCEHRGDDARRQCNGQPYPPFHDVMAMVDGEPAKRLGELARERWYRATGEVIASVTGARDPWPARFPPELQQVRTAIARTSPETEVRSGVREVEALYLDMIEAAQRCIYIENQYFTSHKIARALERRLAEKDGPEVVLVLRLLSHGWLEEHTMEVLRTELVKALQAGDRYGRFGVYFPHVPGLREGTCVDVHSKVMVVDDEWLRIGSANLCNRSMGMDTECDVTFEAAGDERASSAIGAFRDRLLAEHLDVSAAEVAAARSSQRSTNAAIRSLQGRERTLKNLEQLKQWPDAVVELAALADPDQPVSVDNLMERLSSSPVKKAPSRWRAAAIACVVLLGLMALWRYTPLSEYATPERITHLARTFAGQWWAPVLLIVAYTPACLTMFPRPLITLFGVVAFGPWLGATYGMIGVLIAAAITYLMGNLSDPAAVRRFAGDKLNHISDILRKRGLLAMTALRLVPLAPFAVEGLVAGAIRIKFWHFMLGTFFGMLPGAVTTTIFGEQLARGLEDSGEVNYWLLAGVSVALVTGSYFVKRWLFPAGSADKHASRKRAAAQA